MVKVHDKMWLSFSISLKVCCIWSCYLTVVIQFIENVNLRSLSLHLQQDAGPMAHPVRPHSYIKMDNFYTGEHLRSTHSHFGNEVC